jgi:hypothetical protein
MLFRRHEFSYEWFVRALSYRLTNFITDLCDPRLVSYGARPAYELCQRNGMGWEDFTAAFSAMDRLYQAGGGMEPLYVGLPTTSSQQLQQLLGEQLGGSTYAACTASGELWPNQCGDSAVLPAGGAATVSMYGGLVTWQLPEGALAAPVTLTPGSWRHGMYVAPEWDDFHWRNKYDFLPAEVSFAVPVQLTLRYDPALIPAGGSEASLALYDLTAYPYAPVPGSVVDTVTHQVSAKVSRLGLYAVAPR